jgi:hypothetical protein
VDVTLLEGSDLDLVVARAEIARGHPDIRLSAAGRPTIMAVGDGWEPFRPSICWSHAGPIIERERITLVPQASAPRHWIANWEPIPIGAGPITGPTPLVAAMRAYVAGTL